MAKPQAGQSQHALPWRWMGERGLRVETGDTTLARLAQLDAAGFDEIEDMIPADGSLLVILRAGAEPSSALVATLASPPPPRPEASGRLHVLPLRISPETAPDLAECAARAGLADEDYLRELAALVLTVAFLGFQPGFPYLTGLPRAWAMPRRATPRVRVPAGSVALGGAYAGIYPVAGPGGWQLIGQTDVRLFDPARPQPALFAPGDRVRFELRA